MSGNPNGKKTIDFIDYVLLRTDIQRVTNSLDKMTEKSWWWDFWVPMLTAGLVAVIASLITYQFTKRIQKASDLKAQRRHEQNQNIEKENRKIAAINELLLLANSCYFTLQTIRRHYSKHLTNNLKERIFQVPVIEARPLVPVDLELLSRLIFLTPEEEQPHSKWSQVSEIDTLLQQYNMLVWKWAERNKLVSNFYLELDALDNKPDSRSEVFSLFPTNTFMKLFQSTEACVSNTKEVMSELNDLMTNFEKAYLPKLRSDLPNQLLDDVVYISKQSIDMRASNFVGEALADFEPVRTMCVNDAFYKEKVRGLVSSYDWSKYGLD